MIGGNFNVLATDVYKQVIGQQNFQMGAVVGAAAAGAGGARLRASTGCVQRRQMALLSARAVPLRAEAGARLRRADDGLLRASSRC